ncbi:hypothetical protein THAOC_36556 [Thalassiosira oceanica]|uniref:Multidrug and toxin extrusion protein n=1 Tax=Thalassiosira oceanica TaxID=159749 RepID=K0R001_THAOC|nr:hypothetical protein THAOC_36556 [Thalassiosira oceanica]|eukprot:EJK44870.1 hypothetical protein THAOC_36556 [Thalassiosira oceanica]
MCRSDEGKQTRSSVTMECQMTIDRETMISYGSVSPQHMDLEERPLVMEGKKSKSRRHCNKKKLLKDEAEKMTLLAIPVTFTYLLEMLPGVACVVLVGRVENIHEPGDQKVQLDAAALATMMMNVVAMIVDGDGHTMQPSPWLRPAVSYGHLQLDKHHRLDCCFLRELRNSLECRSDTTAPRPAGGGLSMCGAIYEDPDPRHTIAVSLRDNTKGVSGKERGHAHAHNCGSQPSGQRHLWLLPRESSECFLCDRFGRIDFTDTAPQVRYTHFGWLGAAVARTFTFVISIPVVLLSVRLSMSDRVESAAVGKCEGDKKMSDGVEFLQELWKGFVLRDAVSWDALQEFFTLGVPGMLQVMFEWCAFEVLALFCGWFPDDEAVVASVAGSVRLGNALGANDPHRAELATHLSLAAGFFLAFVNMAIILWSRDTLPYLFTTDPDIVEKSKDLFVVAAVFQLPDAINGVFQGVFRGSGDQVIAALWNFVAYYIVGLPLGYVLGLRLGIGVEGLWEGMTAGLCVVAMAYSYITAKTDWAALAERTAQRVRGVP